MSETLNEMDLWQAHAAHQVNLAAKAKHIDAEKWLISQTDNIKILVNMFGDYKRGMVSLKSYEPCYTLSFPAGTRNRPPSRPAILVTSGPLGRGAKERWFTMKPREGK